jgi:hypothetical protein
MKHAPKPAAVGEDLVAAVEVEALAAAVAEAAALAEAVVAAEEAGIAAVVVAVAAGTRTFSKQKDAGFRPASFLV